MLMGGRRGAQLVYDINPDNLVGANGSQFSVFPNAGSAGAAAAAGASVNNRPTLLTQAVNGKPVILFGQNRDGIRLTGSASLLNFIHSRRVFDIYLVAGNGYLSGGAPMWFGNLTSSASKGIGIEMATAGINPFIGNGDGANDGITSTLTCQHGEWAVFRIWGDGVKMQVSKNGGAAQSVTFAHTAGTGNATQDYSLGIKYDNLSDPASMALRRALVYNQPLFAGTSAALIAQLTADINLAAISQTAIICLGDSTTQGSDSCNQSWPTQLFALLTAAHPNAYFVGNRGTGGQLASLMQSSIWPSFIKGKFWSQLAGKILIIDAGINDILNGVAGATVWTSSVKVIADDAAAAGLTVSLTTLMPFSGYAGWTAPFQTEQQAFNTLVKGNGVYPYFDAYAAMGSSVDPTKLSVAGGGNTNPDYATKDGGGVDGLHPNALGHGVKAAGHKTALGL
jgi:lysophospholipase L1-like esterase